MLDKKSIERQDLIATDDNNVVENINNLEEQRLARRRELESMGFPFGTDEDLLEL